MFVFFFNDIYMSIKIFTQLARPVMSIKIFTQLSETG